MAVKEADLVLLESIPDLCRRLFNELTAATAVELGNGAGQRDVDALQAAYDRNLATLTVDARSAHERITAAITEALFPSPANTQDALLREMREQRAWERILRQLDAAGSAVGVIDVASAIVDTAVDAGDELTLAVLRAEAPAYLASKDASLIAGTVLDELEEKWATVSSPEARDALASRPRADAAWAAASTWLESTRDGLPAPPEEMSMDQYIAWRTNYDGAET